MRNPWAISRAQVDPTPFFLDRYYDVVLQMCPSPDPARRPTHIHDTLRCNGLCWGQQTHFHAPQLESQHHPYSPHPGLRKPNPALLMFLPVVAIAKGLGPAAEEQLKQKAQKPGSEQLQRGLLQMCQPALPGM